MFRISTIAATLLGLFHFIYSQLPAAVYITYAIINGYHISFHQIHLLENRVTALTLAFLYFFGAFTFHRCKPTKRPYQVSEEAPLSVEKIRNLYGFQLLILAWGGYCLGEYLLTDWLAFRELAVALLIASIVSLIFDVQYHKRAFGDFVKKIEVNVAKLSSIVGSTPIQDTTQLHQDTQLSMPSSVTLLNMVSQLNGNVSDLRQLVGGTPTGSLPLSAMVTDLKGTASNLSQQVESLTRQVETSNRILGYLHYRQAVQNAYAGANNRIISISDYWAVDEEWWAGGDWKATHFYQTLLRSNAVTNRSIFAGRVPWPDYHAGQENIPESARFTVLDFEKFIGVAWRLVLAHYIRDEKRLRAKDTVRVVVGSVPVPATVVDNDVFVFLQNPENRTDVRASRGTIVAEDDPTTADAYDELICSYLPHVRSAREYIQAILHHAVLCNSDLNLNSPIAEANLALCLDSMGLEEWATPQQGQGPPIDYETRKQRARAVIFAFWETLTFRPTHFRDLRRDLL